MDFSLMDLPPLPPSPTNKQSPPPPPPSPTNKQTQSEQPKHHQISLSFSTLFELIAAMSPIMIVFFIVMISVFNQNVKGLLYLVGLLGAMFLNGLVVGVYDKIKKPVDPRSDIPHICSLPFDYPGFMGNRNSSINSLILAFTAVYIIAPMEFIEGGQRNVLVILSMITFWVIDTAINIYRKCSTPQGYILGTCIGAGAGYGWFSVFNAGNKNLLFFNELIGGKYYCDKPTEQQFKCKVFKNGELVG